VHFVFIDVVKHIKEKYLLDYVCLANPSTLLVVLTVHRW